MPLPNPDFRGADEVIVPANLKDMTGWTDGKVSENEAVLRERRGADRLQSDMPVVTRFAQGPALLPEIEAAWQLFQNSKGRGDKSCDWSLLDEFVIQKPLLFLPQIVGSCVVSNSFRGWIIRLMYQIGLLGQAEEYLGRNEFGKANYAFYGPYTYGCARRRGNMKGGDGLYCEVMRESLLKDGVLSCSTPKLLEILTGLGAASDRDLPEPQIEKVYRAFGDWKYLDDLTPYADFTLQECPEITRVDMLKAALQECKPTFHCSMIAIKKVGDHKDGFAIHKRDPNDQWAHLMCFHGFFYSSDGDLFFRFSNESWGEKHIYNVPYAEVDDWFKRRNVTAAAIGMINGPKSAPVSIG